MAEATNNPSSRQGEKDAKYFLIRCVGQKARKLRPGQSLKIGRHASNDIVLPSGTVSRFHASINWDPNEDRPFVIDNESANGIELDSVLVDGRSYLTGKDNHLEVGDFLLVLSLRGAEGEVDRPAGFAALIDSKLEPDTAKMRLFSERAEGMAGRFADLRGLQRALVQVESDERTGTLKVQVGAKRWDVTFAQGKIVTASHNDQEGMLAIYSLLGQSAGSYEFTRDIEPCENSLNLSPRALFAAETGQTRLNLHD